MARHHPKRIAFLPILALLPALLCAAQNTDEVHVRPRTQQPENKPAMVHTKPIISNVDLVLVPVTVADDMMHIVTGLESSNFILLEDNEPQQVEYFYSQDTPISVGIIFDQSHSIGFAINGSRIAVREFMQASNLDDEFFLITFDSRPVVTNDFASQPEEIEDKLLYTVPCGNTALWDAVYLGLHKMKQAKYPKKVLLIVSDGGENASRYSKRELKRVVREADVQIYGVAVPGADYTRTGLDEVTAATGGRTYLGPVSMFGDSFRKIAIALRNQYVLGYRPSNRKRDGKFHKIRVKLQALPGMPPLYATAMKSGYYAPEH